MPSQQRAKNYTFGNASSFLSMGISDEATPEIADMINNFPKATKIAYQSLGKMVKETIQAGIKGKNAGGKSMPQWQEIKRRVKSGKARNAEVAKKRRQITKQRSTRPFGWLARNVEYRTDGKDYVAIGWLDATTQKYGERMEKGFSFPITRKSERLFAGAGVPLNHRYKYNIKVPARPVIGPVYMKIKGQVSQHFQSKLIEYILRGKG